MMKKMILFAGIYVLILSATACSPKAADFDAEQGVLMDYLPTTTAMPVNDNEQIPLIDIEWPEYVGYQPENKVFPLTSVPHVYKTGVIGPVVFIDERQNPATLPFEPSGYAVIDGIVSPDQEYAHVAYALYSNETGWVLMFIDGTVPLGTDGDYIRLSDEGEDGPWFVNAANTVVSQRGGSLGLYNLEERREVLPCKYDWIEEIDGWLFLAAKDGQGWLFSAKGRELYAFGDVSYGKRTINTRYQQSSGSTYYLNSEKQIFFGFEDSVPRTTVNSIISGIEGDRIEDVQLVDSDYETQMYYLRNNEGKILLSVPYEEGWLMQSGNFVIKRDFLDANSMRADPKAIYSLDGMLLLDNVYGCISEVVGPDGGLFVYTAPNRCVLLYPNGTTVDVPIAPEVELMYWKG